MAFSINPMAWLAARLQRLVGRPACEHHWTQRVTGPLRSDYFYGQELTRSCSKCGKTEAGWTQNGWRYDATGKRVEMRVIHWPGGPVVEDRTPNS